MVQHNNKTPTAFIHKYNAINVLFLVTISIMIETNVTQFNLSYMMDQQRSSVLKCINSHLKKIYIYSFHYIEHTTDIRCELSNLKIKSHSA